MEVQAIKPAFFNGFRVRVGDVLEVPEGAKGSWFARTGSAELAVAVKAAKAVAKKEKVSTPATLSEMAKAPTTAATDLT